MERACSSVGGHHSRVRRGVAVPAEAGQNVSAGRQSDALMHGAQQRDRHAHPARLSGRGDALLGLAGVEGAGRGLQHTAAREVSRLQEEGAHERIRHGSRGQMDRDAP